MPDCSQRAEMNAPRLMSAPAAPAGNVETAMVAAIRDAMAWWVKDCFNVVSSSAFCRTADSVCTGGAETSKGL